MPIRSQIDTSVYRGNGGNTTSFGDIMSLVNGIAGLGRASRESKKQDQEDEDLRFINDTVGKYMQGYNGQDANDLYQRKQSAYNEIMTTKPHLSKYVAPRQEADFKGLQDYRKNDLVMQNDQVTLDSNKEVLKKNQRINLDDETKRKIERSMEAAQKLSEVQDEFGYGKVLQDYGDVLGEIDPYYQNYATSQNPATAFWRSKAGQIKQQRLAEATKAVEDRDLLVREKEAGIGNKNADTTYKGAQVRGIDSEIKKRQWDMDHPKSENSKFGSLTGFNAPEALSYAGMAMGQFSKMKQLIDTGDAKFYERGMLGSFTNPEFKKTLDFLSNYIGRQDSGAAINNDEWKTFKGLIADRDLMMTPEGRQQVSNLLGEYIGRTYNMGVMQTKGNENWYEDYKNMATGARQKYGGEKPKATDDDIILKYLGGK